MAWTICSAGRPGGEDLVPVEEQLDTVAVAHRGIRVRLHGRHEGGVRDRDLGHHEAWLDVRTGREHGDERRGEGRT